MSKLYHGLCGILFCSASVGFAYGSYALGAWLAIGTIGCAVRAMLDDHVKGMPGVASMSDKLEQAASDRYAAQAVQLEALLAKLAKVESRCEGMNSYLSALNTIKSAPGRAQSPLRPPSGAGPRG